MLRHNFDFSMVRGKILAVDFDGTLAEVGEYPLFGKAIPENIEFAKKWQEAGGYIVLWTCRENEALVPAVEWCRSQGLCFDAINDNIEKNKKEYGNNCRKVGADYFLDDRNIKF